MLSIQSHNEITEPWELIIELSSQAAALLLGYRSPSYPFYLRLNEQHMLNNKLPSSGDFTAYMLHLCLFTCWAAEVQHREGLIYAWNAVGNAFVFHLRFMLRYKIDPFNVQISHEMHISISKCWQLGHEEFDNVSKCLDLTVWMQACLSECASGWAEE